MANLACDPLIGDGTMRRTGPFLLTSNLVLATPGQLAKSDPVSRILPAAKHDLSLDNRCSTFPLFNRLRLGFLFNFHF